MSKPYREPRSFRQQPSRQLRSQLRPSQQSSPPPLALPLPKTKIDSTARVAVLGVGSDLRSDDAAGLLALEDFRRLTSIGENHPRVGTWIGGTAPENVTGVLRRFAPTHLYILDAAHFKGFPGAIRAIAPSEVGGATFSSHQMPIPIFMHFLATDLPDTEMVIIGIQPGSVEFGFATSPEVRQAAETVAIWLANIVAPLIGYPL
ncbi:MAG: hydrogenase 3 maturation endopeptidase HyCI [Candidatus Riflebacteria bacterium]|nr:hydrogenase 3 maturation endopeptidase HyCI [Candidatus Riflebacteria bacterium]